jgi:hypothetical protein
MSTQPPREVQEERKNNTVSGRGQKASPGIFAEKLKIFSKIFCNDQERYSVA